MSKSRKRGSVPHSSSEPGAVRTLAVLGALAGPEAAPLVRALRAVARADSAARRADRRADSRATRAAAATLVRRAAATDALDAVPDADGVYVVK